MKSTKFICYILSGVVISSVFLPNTTYAKNEITTINEIKGSFEFDLNAHVYDYGEAINSITFSIDSLVEDGIISPQVDITTITNETFNVYSTGTNNYQLPEEPDLHEIYTNVERKVTDVIVSDDNMEITLLLETKNNGAGQNTLNYAGSINRNLEIDLEYKIDQILDFNLTSGDIISETTEYVQSDIINNEELELFDQQVFSDKKNTLQYQYYKPENAQDGNKHPLIIWFHGKGEGGYEDIQNNTSQLKANRGALGFITDEAQDIFGGAHVISPQSPDTWYSAHEEGHVETMKNLIDTYCLENNIDTNRIYVYGASAGGYMTIRMAVTYPEMFAAVVPICPALNVAVNSGGVETTEADIKTLINNNVWLIHSKDDPVIDYKPNTEWIKSLLPEAKTSLYENVVISGNKYNGHFTWIYAAKNLPVNADGETLWEWTAKQNLQK